MDITERRKYYLASGENEIDAHGREAEIGYKNFLLEYILSGESINDLGEDLFDFKSSNEEERVIREKAAFLFKHVADTETLKAILDLIEAVFNFVAIADAAPRVQEAIANTTRRKITQPGRNKRSSHVAEREEYVKQLLASYAPDEAMRATAKKVAHDLKKILALKGIDPDFSILPKEVGKSLQKVRKKQPRSRV